MRHETRDMRHETRDMASDRQHPSTPSRPPTLHASKDWRARFPCLNNMLGSSTAITCCSLITCSSLPRRSVRACQRLVFYCRTTSASTAPCTSRRTCCPYAYVLITVLDVVPARDMPRDRQHPSTYSSLIGFTSCIVKSFRSRRSFISSPLWTPEVYGPTF